MFKGKAHDPGGDYVERIYEKTGNVLEFKISTELEAFGTRDAGRVARTKIENLMNKGQASIVFDFANVHLISSSFADEGKLFVSLGPIGFEQLCQFANVDSTIQTLINRAIAQRIKQ